MKTNTTLKLIAAALTVALSPLAHATQLPGVAEQPDSYFYTGKPYDADLGAYTFAARTYDPKINRWTTADPSGFPDGANNQLYTNSPIVHLDIDGLEVVEIIDPEKPSWAGEGWTDAPINWYSLTTSVGWNCQNRYKREFEGWSDSINSCAGKKGEQLTVNASVTFSEQKNFSFTAAATTGSQTVSWTYGGSTSSSCTLGSQFSSPSTPDADEWWEAQLVIAKVSFVNDYRTTAINTTNNWGEWKTWRSIGPFNSQYWGIRWVLCE